MNRELSDTEGLALLDRRLRRERARREAAELIGERVTGELFATVTQLQTIQAEMAEKADRERTVADVARSLSTTVDTEAVLTDGSARIGALVGVERCQVHLGDPAGRYAVGDWWADAAERDRADEAVPFQQLPSAVLHLLQGGAPEGSTLVVTDAASDPRLGRAAADVVAVLGGALAAFPVRCDSRLLGWLLLVSAEPRSWTARDLAVADGAADELGVALARLAAAEQRESVLRLQELDRAKDALLSNVSHELRTPLASIGGYAELLMAGDLGQLPDPALRAVEIMNRNVERLSRLVENLLRHSSASEALPLDLCDLDLGEIVDAGRATLWPVVQQRRLQVSVVTEPELRPVRGDRAGLEQVVHNLLSNAAKFTECGGRISVRLANTGHGVSLTVADSGIGIPTEEQASVFTRFFRSSLSVSGELPGTGLGLALSKSIVEQHGGRISLTSLQGMGTTVRVELPTAVG